MSEPSTNTSHAGAERPVDVVILLAGGAGSRFVGPHHKLLAPLPKSQSHRASSVFARSLATAWQADIGPVVVVHGALDEATLTDDPVVRSITDADPRTRPVEFVHNPDWASGQASSLQQGLAAARRYGAAGAVVGLADQPGITVDAWRTVATGLGPIVVATYDGRRGNPVRLDADVWKWLPVSGDEGARTLMRLRPELVTGVPCSGSPNDIDTVEDLHTWQSN